MENLRATDICHALQDCAAVPYPHRRWMFWFMDAERKAGMESSQTAGYRFLDFILELVGSDRTFDVQQHLKEKGIISYSSIEHLVEMATVETGVTDQS